MHPLLPDLLEAQAGVPIGQQMVLPDAFLVCDPNAPAWASIIPQEHMRSCAKTLLSLIDLPKAKLKAVKADNPELIFTVFFGSLEVRHLNTTRVHAKLANSIEWSALVTAAFRTLLDELDIDRHDFDYDRTHLAKHNLERTVQYVLGMGALEKTYELSTRQKALLDLVICSELSAVQCPEFVHEYLELHPHLEPRLSAFALGCREQLRLRARRSPREVRAEQVMLEWRNSKSRYESTLIAINRVYGTDTPSHTVAPVMIRLRELLRGAGTEVPKLFKLYHDDTSEASSEALNEMMETIERVPTLSSVVEAHALVKAKSEALPVLVEGSFLTVSYDQIQSIFELHEELIVTCDDVTEFASQYKDDIQAIKEKITSLVGSAEQQDIEDLQELASVSADMTKTLQRGIVASFDAILLQHQELVEQIHEANTHANPIHRVDADQGELIKQYEQEVDYLNSEVNALRRELREAKKTSATLRARQQMEGKGENVEEAELSRVLRSVLTGTTDRKPQSILELYSLIAPERLVVLDSAFDSAETVSSFVLTERLSASIDNLIYPYLDAINNGEPDTNARKHIGHSYAANESETVLSSRVLRAQREFEYLGEKVLFKQHISIGTGTNPAHSLRLYFKVIDNKIVIAYCGRHLDTATGR